MIGIHISLYVLIKISCVILPAVAILKNGEHTDFSSLTSECSLSDLAFLIDSSKSIGTDNFNEIKSFMSNLTSQLNVGPNSIRTSAISFDASVNSLWNFANTQSKQDLRRRIQSIEYSDGNKRLARALTHVFKYTFTKQQGSRTGVPKLLIIFTDGQSRDDSHLRVKRLKKYGIRVIMVSVGTNIDTKELNEIIGNSNDVISINEVQEVIDLIQNLSAVPCANKGPVQCYNGVKTYFGNMNVGSKIAAQCETGSVCAQISAEVQSVVVGYSLAGEVYYGQCVSSSSCSLLTCYQLSKLFRISEHVTVQNCTAKCCSTDLCNTLEVTESSNTE